MDYRSTKIFAAARSEVVGSTAKALIFSTATVLHFAGFSQFKNINVGYFDGEKKYRER